jgi:hypothetical protein
MIHAWRIVVLTTNTAAPVSESIAFSTERTMEQNDCEIVWQTGVEYTLPGDRRNQQTGKMETVKGTSPAFSKKAFNCEVETDDTPPKYVSATLPLDKVQSVIGGLKVIAEAPTENGVYTWILWKGYDTTKPTFAATKVEGGVLELGTAHLAIAAKMASSTADKRITVHGAGELKVDGGKITFNLLSGTFVAAWTRSKKGGPQPKLCKKGDVQDYIASIFPRFVPRAEYDDSMDTYITQKTITGKEITEYRQKGWDIKVFDTQEACKAAGKPEQTAGRRRTYRRCRKCGLPKKPETQ